MGQDWGITLLVLVGLYTHFASTSSYQEVGLTRHVRATTFLHFIFVRCQPVTQIFRNFQTFFLRTWAKTASSSYSFPATSVIFFTPHKLRN
jgi:hypothetical protein